MKRIATCIALALAAGAAHAATTEFVIYKDENFRGASHKVKGEVNNLEGGFASAGSSLKVLGGNWEVCTRSHFKGECFVLAPGEYARLGPLDDKIVAVRFVEGKKAATVEARDRALAMRDKREAREERRDGRNDDRYARDERRDWRDEGRERRATGTIELYGRQDFRGRSVRVDDNTRDLARFDFDGRASSLVVHEGVWELCTEPGYQGRCLRYGPGEYRHLAGLDDRVASARQLR
jgi:hypothetical protein